MNDPTPAPYGEITRRFTHLSEADAEHHARRLLGVGRQQANIERPDAATAGHYRQLVVAARGGDEVAFAWLATTHRPLLLARGRLLYANDPSEWGAIALEALHTTLRRVDPDEDHWLRRTVALRLSSLMWRHTRRQRTRSAAEQPTDPTRFPIRIHPAGHAGHDPHPELSAALADLLGRLDVPTRAGLRALADEQTLEPVADAHQVSPSALRQRVTRARHQLQPELATFVRTVA